MDSKESLLCKDIGDRLVTLQLHRSLLEKDVQRLKTKLKYETDIRKALETGLGFGDEDSNLDDVEHNLPAEVRELLSDVSSVESVVSNLEDKVVLLRHEIGSARADRTRIIVDSGETSLESLQARVEELKIKVHDIEVVSSDVLAQDRHRRIKTEQTFLGLPLGSNGKRKLLQTKTAQVARPRRNSLDDADIGKSKQQRANVPPLFGGKLYSSVDVPSASSLLGRLRSKKKPPQ